MSHTIRVDGRVLGPTGAPIAGAVVVIDADYANPAVTGADGVFLFPEVETPYDLLLVSPPITMEYRGLRQPNPVLRSEPGAADDRQAQVRIDVTGAAFPLAEGERIRISTRDGYTSVSTAATDSAGVYVGNLFWSGPTTFTTDLVALHTARDASGAIRYLASGVLRDVTLVEGELQEDLTIALDQTIAITGTTFVHSAGLHTDGYDTTLAYLVQGARFVDKLTQPSGSVVSYPVDNPIFRALGYRPGGGYADRFIRPTPDGETAIHLPETVQLANALPVDGAAGVSTTPTLFWTPVPGATLTAVTIFRGAGGHVFILPGATNRLEIPDYSGLGVGLTADTSYDWIVQSLSGAAFTVDRVAGQYSEPERIWEGPGSVLNGAPTTFRTAP